MAIGSGMGIRTDKGMAIGAGMGNETGTGTGTGMTIVNR